MTKGQSFISLLSKYLPRLISILLGVFLGLMTAKIYFLLSRNLILENYMLECEINDYIATKLEAKND